MWSLPLNMSAWQLCPFKPEVLCFTRLHWWGWGIRCLRASFKWDPSFKVVSTKAPGLRNQKLYSYYTFLFLFCYFYFWNMISVWKHAFSWFSLLTPSHWKVHLMFWTSYADPKLSLSVGTPTLVLLFKNRKICYGGNSSFFPGKPVRPHTGSVQVSQQALLLEI